MRRGNIDALAIHGNAGSSGRYWGWHGLNAAGCIAIVTGMAVAVMTMKSPLYDGPLARALGGADLSWILGFPVSGLLYWLLTAKRTRAPVNAPTPLPATSE
jgi:cytosine/uracil/thiamine/allantoin permease